MKKLGFYGVLLLTVAALLTGSALGAEVLIPVGQTIGLELDARGLTVADFDRELGESAREAGLRTGDTIIKADGQEVTDAKGLRELVERAKDQLVLTVLRDGKEKNMTLKPVEVNGSKRLGIYVREGITGIGTVTYYDPASGRFGALGHGVSNGAGDLIPLEEGTALQAEVIQIERGKIGAPGQLRGAFHKEKVLGMLERNTSCGVFGKAPAGWGGTPLPIGEAGEIHTGQAQILSNLAGSGVQEYDVEITRVYANQGQPGRNMLIHVTDPELLEKTGGIVQGMSGSPLVQDGKLIGAVTHVLVNDPTMGYGIFIENMLEAAG